MKRARRWLLMGALFWTSTAQAYLLPPEFVVDYMIRGREKFSGLEVSQTVQVFDPKFSDGKRQGKETVFLRKPSDLRIDATYGSVRQTWVNQGSQAIVITDGKLTEEGRNEPLPFKDLFLIDQGAALMRRLEEAGIDTKRISLGRKGARVMYVLGAVDAKSNDPMTDKPQLWIDKDTFQPAQLILRETVDGKSTRVEIRYDEFGRNGPAWYPGAIDVYFDKTLVASLRTERAGVRPNLADQLFNLRELRQKYPAAAANPNAVLSATRFSEMLAELKKRGP